MYNFNDFMTCAEPYGNFKRIGAIVGMIPININCNYIYLVKLRIRDLANMYSELVQFHVKILSKYIDLDGDVSYRVFHHKGYTFLAMESDAFNDNQYKDKIITWKDAAAKCIYFMESKRALIKYHSRRFKTDIEEYEFLVNAIEIGSIDAIRTIAEINQTDLMIQAFYRASIQLNTKTMVKRIAPTYYNVIDIKSKLIRRWQIKECKEVFDFDDSSMHRKNIINAILNNSPTLMVKYKVDSIINGD